jgi:predicted RNA-binding protein with PUA-like domain
MARWLVKSEPDVFGWEHQARAGTEPWTGVRNHQAKLHLMAMKKGDLAFFYHSNIGKEVVGIVRVVRTAYPDPTVTAADRKGDWVCVDMQAVGPFRKPVSMAEMKAVPELAGMVLLNNARLSVQPVTLAEWRIVCRMGGFRG